MSSIRVSMVCCETTILAEIAEPAFKRWDIAKTYWFCMRSDEAATLDWGKINKAIMERWSFSGLNYIKELAHSGKCWDAETRAAIEARA